MIKECWFFLNQLGVPVGLDEIETHCGIVKNVALMIEWEGECDEINEQLWRMAKR